MNGKGVSARVPAPDVAPRGKKRSAYATKWFVAALLPLAFTIAGSRVKAVALTGSAAVCFFLRLKTRAALAIAKWCFEAKVNSRQEAAALE